MVEVSVVVVTKNSEKHIDKCLKSIFSQDKVDFEVVIIYENSEDNTLKILLSYHDNRMRIVQIPEGISIGMARQHGVMESYGDIIAWVDSDVELPHNLWLRNMLLPFNNYIIAGTTTLAMCHDSDPWYLKLQHRFEYGTEYIGIDDNYIVGTSHLLMRKKLITYVGGFDDVKTYEDIGLTKKIMKLGFFFKYMPEERCYHYYADSFLHFIKKKIKIYKLNIVRLIENILRVEDEQ